MTPRIFTVLTLILLTISPFWVTKSFAQSAPICGPGPFLGVSAAGAVNPVPEICVALSETAPIGSTLTGASTNFRGPSPMVIATTLGDYNVNLTITFTPGPAAHALTIDGTVTKLSNTSFGGSPGGLLLNTLAGYGPSLGEIPADSIVMLLDGMATGTSQTKLGAGVARPALTTGDVEIVGFPVVLDETTNQAGAFSASQLLGNFDAGVVAVSTIVSFHVNDVGASIAIPASVIVGKPPYPVAAGVAALHFEPHFECYDVEVGEKPEFRAVKLVDQFAKAQANLGKITRICTPVSKNEEKVPNPKLHLVCYEILEGHKVNQTVQTTNQFDTHKMTVLNARELCVPSLKKHLDENQK